MNALNAALMKLTGVVLTPFANLPAQVALIVLSAIAGLLAAIAFRYSSPQTRIKGVADQVRASLLAMRLFKDDLRSVFAAQGALFKASGLRLVYSVPPMLVLAVPFALLVGQLAMWYEFAPLTPGAQALVEVEIAPHAWATHQDLQLAPPGGVEAVGPVRDAAAGLLSWRVTAPATPTDEQALTLRFLLGDQDVAEKQLVVSGSPHTDKLLFVSSTRAGPSIWDRLLHTGEPAFGADSPVQRISVAYAVRTNTLFGVKIHWFVTLLIVSILGALASKPFVKVQF